MAIGALRVPVRIAESYVRPGDEKQLFPNFPEYLTLDEVKSIWPRGLITHEKFHHKGSLWRLAKRPMANGNTVYMAILDDPSANGNGNGIATANGTLPARSATPDTMQRLRSVPLDTFSPHQDSSDLGLADYNDIHTRIHRGLTGHHSFHHAHSGPLSSHSSAQRELALQPFSGGSAGGLTSSFRDRNPSHTSMALVASQPSNGLLVAGSFSLGSGSNGFMTDLLAATESPMPLDRYKAFVRLFCTLNRTREALRLPPATPAAAAEDVADPGWESGDAQDLIRQMVMVGECLAKFGTAEFVDGRNNSSRAITTKDYAKLLRMYLEKNGAVFREDFISRLPLLLQDEVLTVRTLLQTRCETNDMLFNQLVKHVGQEPTAGGAMVFNNVTANPTNHMLAAPRTLVNTVSNAWSKADVKRRTQIGALGAVAVVALWLVKRKLFGSGGGGGGGGRKGRRGTYEDSDWGGSSGRRSNRTRSNGDLATRLLDERSSAERMAVRFLSACQDELRRSQHNDQLLRSDWRLGPIRLAMPGSSNMPEGYEPVQVSYCSVGSFMNALDGGAPLALPPYGFTERSQTTRESGSVATTVAVE
ncbi:hypothetical protein Vafri_16852 [Volvox africanus]|uniref:Uncharacterized protein n=1 Tax=Volvox africanus TaxID=51714 RepID=A0A8J4F748_9CHLO|nr:hypothetical protein Vafri_16852 [Volvox africanus]